MSSRELEQELEKELEATEAKQNELRDRIQRLEVEKDEWKVRARRGTPATAKQQNTQAQMIARS